MTAPKTDKGGVSWWMAALIMIAMAATYVTGRIDQQRHDRRAVSAFTQRIFVSAIVCGASGDETFACKQLAEFSTERPLSARSPLND
jgi:hypothetical protein